MNQSPEEAHQRVTVITNKYANRGRAAAQGEKVSEILRSLECDVDHHQPIDLVHSNEIVRNAIKDGRHLVGVGGDGLIHHLVQSCAETSATLGLVPAGTGNDFFFGLDLPIGLRMSTQAAIGPTQRVDVLRFERESEAPTYGATIATAGFSAAVNIRAENMSWPRGSSRYTLATLRELANLKRYQFELVVDGVEIAGECLMIAIANTRAFGGGMQIAPDANPFDGEADVVIVRDTSALDLLRMLPKTFKGTHVNHPAVEIIKAESLLLTSRNSQDNTNCGLRSDGEDVGSLPQAVTVVPGGLHVAGLSPPLTISDEAKEQIE